MVRRVVATAALALLALAGAWIHRAVTAGLRAELGRAGVLATWRSLGVGPGHLTAHGVRITGPAGLVVRLDALTARAGARWTWLGLPPLEIRGLTAHAPGLPRVAVTAARLAPDGGITADGTLEARPWSLAGRATADDVLVTVTGPALADLRHRGATASIGRVTIAARRGDARVTAHDVRAHATVRGTPVSATIPEARWTPGEVALESGLLLVDAPAPERPTAPQPTEIKDKTRDMPIARLTWRGLDVRPAGPVALGGARVDATWTPGLITAEIRPDAGGRLAVTAPPDAAWLVADLDAVPLAVAAPLLPAPLPGTGVVTGQVIVPDAATRAAALDVRFAGELRHRAVSADAVAGEVRLTAWVTDGPTVEGRLRVGAIEASGAASLLDRRVRLAARLTRVSCQAAWDSLPDGLRGPLTAARLSGHLAPRLDLDLPLDDAFALRLDLSGELGCRVDALRLPPAAWPPGEDAAPRDDVAWLLGPFARVVPEATRRVVVGPGSGEYWPLARLPRYVVDAAIVSEDPAFGPGHALDLGLLRRALMFNVDRRAFVYGGSTIPQQLVKNLFLTREKTVARKLQEAIIALRVAAAVPAPRILELYLNCIEFAPNVYGIGPAARYYFGVSPGALTPRQAAFLAMAKPSPRYAAALRRRGQTPDTEHFRTYMRRILERLVARGTLSTGALEAAKPFRIEWPAPGGRADRAQNPRQDADLGNRR